MKGIVFNAFFDMLDQSHGANFTEGLIAETQLRNGGAFTAVGRYDAAEMGALVTRLSEKTGLSAPDLLRTFGRFLLGAFSSGHAEYFGSCSNVLDFVESIEGQVHVDVLKLYPDAELPRLQAERVSSTTLVLTYRSSRRMADLAEGLLQGAIAHYGAPMRLEREDLPDEGGMQCTRFRLSQNS